MTVRVLFVVACVGLFGCGEGSVELFVDLKTDFAGGGEISRVRTTVVAVTDGATTAQEETEVGYDDDLFSGVRVGRFGGLARGAYLVRVALLEEGRVVAERAVRAEVRSSTGLTVLITRDCEDVRCPAEGDSADRTECLGGMCVPPTCSPAHPEACGEAVCAADSDCGEGVACAQPRCVEGVCLRAPSTGACGSSQWCDPDVGCVERTTPTVDAGTDAGGVALGRTIAYFKASNTDAGDQFGSSVALSADGATLAVGAYWEDSAAPGVGGDPSDDSAPQAGAVYVFRRSPSGVWAQEAYLKASNTGAQDRFGGALSLSADGATLAVGAYLEAGGSAGVGGNQDDNSAARSGAVYLYD